mmetsp:Transcript_11107/g.9835  ORF Transcript_11107/g.9835 Transcript_11107/m.9835 type:complete len:229 (+) Transcript_11107:246-932(+)
MNHYFLILNQGLRIDVFYWEFINTLRKILILLAFLCEDWLKVLLASLVLVITVRIQVAIHPYKVEQNNNVEIMAVFAGLITILSSVLFIGEIQVKNLNNFFLFFSIFVNLVFVLKWLALFLQIYQNKSEKIKLAVTILNWLTRSKTVEAVEYSETSIKLQFTPNKNRLKNTMIRISCIEEQKSDFQLKKKKSKIKRLNVKRKSPAILCQTPSSETRIKRKFSDNTTER